MIVIMHSLISAWMAAKSTWGQDRLAGAMSAILRSSLRVRGFIQSELVSDHYAAFQEEIGPLVRSGHIRYREDIVEGLDNAPAAYRNAAGQEFRQAAGSHRRRPAM